MEYSEELRDDGQRGTKDGRRDFGDSGKAFPLARWLKGYLGRVHEEGAYVHMPCCKRKKVRSEPWIIWTE